MRVFLRSAAPSSSSETSQQQRHLTAVMAPHSSSGTLQQQWHLTSAHLSGAPLRGGWTPTPEPAGVGVGSNCPHLSSCSEPCGLEQRILRKASVPRGKYGWCCTIHIFSLGGYDAPAVMLLLITLAGDVESNQARTSKNVHKNLQQQKIQGLCPMHLLQRLGLHYLHNTY